MVSNALIFHLIFQLWIKVNIYYKILYLKYSNKMLYKNVPLLLFLFYDLFVKSLKIFCFCLWKSLWFCNSVLSFQENFFFDLSWLLNHIPVTAPTLFHFLIILCLKAESFYWCRWISEEDFTPLPTWEPRKQHICIALLNVRSRFIIGKNT